MSDVQLRYMGGGSLLFHDASGTRRQVLAGQAFTTDEATARVLAATDSQVTLAEAEPAVTIGSAAGPATATPQPNSSQASVDLSDATVAQLRERLAAAGLSSDGNKAALTDRLGAFEAGRAAAGSASISIANPSTGSDVDPSSSEAEPEAPPPPTGGTLPQPGPSVMANVSKESAGTGSAPGLPTPSLTGPVTLGDLPDSGKVKS